ncbi:hypothetical protein [Sandaracinus amylolyticus]|uniref:hypothetical protein n=1 Tax=Sandaracinus amylolyticus TaxID=927083 RepID=UPI001F29CFD1|nr:hypothetical protein [Sandaracinus amylolyticus]UJR85277.1 Hypothetical protein I5071_73570 [Sandaracinus amylolyticus]
MREPIDDERARRAIDVMRSLAFAVVAAAPGALVVLYLSQAWVFGEPEWSQTLPEPSGRHAWVAAGTTAILAGIAAWRARAIDDVLKRAAIAGAAHGPIVMMAFAIMVGIEQRSTARAAELMGLGICGLACSGTVGLSVGSVFGAWLAPLVGVLARDVAKPTITSVPRAIFVCALWCAVSLAIESSLFTSVAVRVLAASAGLVALGALVEMVRRIRWTRRITVGSAEWSVERGEDGTRWLVREARVGDGAYREGALRVRWGRLDG